MTIDKVTIRATYTTGVEIIQIREVEHRFYGSHHKSMEIVRKKIAQLEKETKGFNKDLIGIEIIKIH